MCCLTYTKLTLFSTTKFYFSYNNSNIKTKVCLPFHPVLNINYTNMNIEQLWSSESISSKF